MRAIHHQGLLLRDGVPVVGRISDVRRDWNLRSHRRNHIVAITYRFKDDQGVERQGTYYPDETWSLDEKYAPGQEVTVLYDPHDPSRHMLDADNVRRAEARVRELP